MSARRRVHRRIQPYAWLGAGAVTIGMGAAMMAGVAAVASADTGADSASAAASAGDASSAKSDAPKARASRSGRGGAAASEDGSRASAPTARGGVAGGLAGALTDDELPVAEPADTEAPAEPADTEAPAEPADTEAPAAPGQAATVAKPGKPRSAAAAPVDGSQPAAAPTADSAAETVNSGPTPAAGDTVAAEPGAAAAVGSATVSDPAPSMESWLPATPIVPGQRLALAREQIAQSQALINDVTWGAGNILAGMSSLGPQAALATSELMLSTWASSIGSAQEFVRTTVGNPLLHGVAQVNLQNQLNYPALSDLSLATASALITPLGWFGADIAGVQALVGEARQNGKVYAKVPVRVVAGTQPVSDVKINGGSKAVLLIDTGASGLVTTRDKVGSAGLGPKTGDGVSCFSGGLCYHFETYNTTVDLGAGAVGAAPVNIVTDNTEYPDSEQEFKDFFSWGADGILGLGANTAGPGPAPIPTAAMPGELSNGILIYQNAYPFGLGGYMILGPNLFPTRVSLAGAPDAYVKVSVNGGPKQDAGAIIDTGGVYGTLNRSLYPGSPAGFTVPAGAKIDVYAPDGATLLYTYTTQGESAATSFIDAGLFNTGNAPYGQNPIYLNYGATPYGIGSTDFSIY